MRKRLDPRGLQEKASSVSLDGLENRLTALWAVLIPGVHVAVLLKGHRCTNNSASVGGGPGVPGLCKHPHKDIWRNHTLLSYLDIMS